MINIRAWAHDRFINAVVHAFDNGVDTAHMAKTSPGKSEAEYERALHLGLERRRVQRVAEQLGANV